MLFPIWRPRRRSARPDRRRSFRTGSSSLVECLEDRTLLTAYLVDTLEDTIAIDGKVSLREAIQAANTNAAVNEAAAGEAPLDAITFDASLAGGTIVLSGTRLDVAGPLSITGLGASQLTISGDDAVQIFSVAAAANVQISNLTLADGFGASTVETQDGGAIANEGTLTLTSVVISNSRTTFRGAAIYNEGSVTMTGGVIEDSDGTDAVENSAGSFSATNMIFRRNLAGAIRNWESVSIDQCLFEDNVSLSGAAIDNFGGQATVSVARSQFLRNDGGAISHQGLTFQIVDSTFTGNSADSAGAILNVSGEMEIRGSTFNQNHATVFHGGAIYSSGTLRMSNSTVSGNDASWSGGGLYVVGGETTLRNVTVFGNRANIDDALGDGGGIYVATNIGTVTLYNTIVAGNTVVHGTEIAQDIFGLSVFGTNNFVSSAGAAGVLVNGEYGNIIGVDWTTVLDPVLRDNGGSTLTHALLAGSVAIDAGSDAEALDPQGNALATDQRGTARILGTAVDMGAFELPTSFVVDTLVDENDGDYRAGDLSLREAIEIVDDGGTISFATSLSGGTIVLTMGELVLDRDVTITGLGTDQLTIDADGNSSIFQVGADITAAISGLTLTGGLAAGFNGGAIFTAGTLTLTGCTIDNSTATYILTGIGVVGGNGGGIYNAGALTVTDSNISGNSAVNGSGIYNADNATLKVIGSTLSGNSAGTGGGIFNIGTLTVTGGTISGNSTTYAGGIYNVGATTLIASTVSGNSATGNGGGIYNTGGELTVTDSTISGNSAYKGGGIDSRLGELTVTDSTISGNTATFDGGGIDSRGKLTVANSTLSGNSASSGGGISSDGFSVVNIENSTFSGNSARFAGGGIYRSGGMLSLTNVTLTGNRADSDGAGGVLDIGGGLAGDAVNVRLANTIIAGNSRGTGNMADDISWESGTIAAASHNLIGDAATSGGLTNGSNGNIVGVDWTTVLDPVLRDNGGPTMTHVLLAGGAAIDAGSDAEAIDADGQPLMFDQRGTGFLRLLRAHVDIGAFESQNSPPTAHDDVIESGEGSFSNADLLSNDSDPEGDLLSIVAINGDAAAVGSMFELPSGAALVVTADGLLTFEANGVYEGMKEWDSALVQFTYDVSDGVGGVTTATVTINIHGQNDPSFATDDAASVEEDETVTGNLLANDTDIDGDALYVDQFGWFDSNMEFHHEYVDSGQTVTLPTGARLTVNWDGTFVYDSAGAFTDLRRGETAEESFSYAITDGKGYFPGYPPTATVTITIIGEGGDDLIGYYGGEWIVGASRETSFNSTPWANWSDIAPAAVQHGDFNGDGLVDVVGFKNGAWWVGISNGTSFDTSRWGSWSPRVWKDVTQVAVGDVDGDGDDDVLANYRGSWWVGLSDGTSFTPQRWAGWSDKPWQHVSLVDLDADGDDDLLANFNGAWWASLSTGSGFETATRWGAWKNLLWEAVGTFDANGDGRTDIYGFVSRYAFTGGRWYVGISNGTSFTFSLRSVWKDEEWSDAIAGDFNGDGLDDLAARMNGAWWVSLSTPTGEAGTTSHWAAWKDVDWQNVTVGDFDGDGRDDIAARSNFGWWVARSTGTGFETALWDTWRNVDWTGVAAVETSNPPVSASSASLKSAQSASEHDALASLWTSAEDDEFAAALLAV